MSNYEKPPGPAPQEQKKTYSWWVFALHLAACYFIPALVARNDFLFNLERNGGDIYIPILAAIGGIIMATAGTSWILRILLFIAGSMVSFPFIVVSVLINYCGFRRLCL
jgi:hypothetical protein